MAMKRRTGITRKERALRKKEDPSQNSFSRKIREKFWG